MGPNEGKGMPEDLKLDTTEMQRVTAGRGINELGGNNLETADAMKKFVEWMKNLLHMNGKEN